jgi:hypothetical protein
LFFKYDPLHFLGKSGSAGSAGSANASNASNKVAAKKKTIKNKKVSYEKWLGISL